MDIKVKRVVKITIELDEHEAGMLADIIADSPRFGGEPTEFAERLEAVLRSLLDGEN